jgi:putative Mn2+ efflux pump MntP
MILIAILRLVVTALYQNVDNFALAAAYRIRNVVIPTSANLLIAALSGAATGFAAMTGYASSCAMDLEAEHLGLGTSISEKTGRGILLMLGVWILVGYFRKGIFCQLRENDPIAGHPALRAAFEQNAPAVRLRSAEGFVVAVALAADNVAPSFCLGGAGLIRNDALLSSLFLGLFTAALSVVAVVLGQAAGKRGIDHLPWISPTMASGCLMIAIALLNPGDFARAWLKP